MVEGNYFDLSLQAAKQLPEKPGIELISEKFSEVEAICTRLAYMPRENRKTIANLLANAHRVALNRKVNNIEAWNQALETITFVYQTIREVAYDSRDMQLLEDLNAVLDERIKSLRSEYMKNGFDLADLEISRNMNAGVSLIGELKTGSLISLKRLIDHSNRLKRRQPKAK